MPPAVAFKGRTACAGRFAMGREECDWWLEHAQGAHPAAVAFSSGTGCLGRFAYDWWTEHVQS